MANSTEEFLPKDYIPTTDEFMKLNEGDNDIRILSRPLIGKLWWVSPEGVVRGRNDGQKGDRPVRVDYKTELPDEVTDAQVKEFWMMKVWDYNSHAIKILEITQQTIIKALNEFIANKKWGDPRAYDINIKREGTGMDTKYYVMPSPPSAIDGDIKIAFKENKTDLTQVLNSPEDDPFEGMDVDEHDVKDMKKNIKTSEPDEEEIDDKDLPF